MLGASKEELLSDDYSPVKGYWRQNDLVPQISEIAAGSFKSRNPPAIKGSGYVVNCLEAALWAFYSSNSFREGCLLAANLGDDADTTTAVYGQIAGAYYGEDGIPGDWRQKLAKLETIQLFADGLCAHKLTR
jgi:ADP-ribosyl-[dinitrogen reductase] hydrolase